MINDWIFEYTRSLNHSGPVDEAFSHEELHTRWLELLMMWRKRAGGVYLKAVDRVRSKFGGPDQIWLARKTLEKVVTEEVGNRFIIEIKNATSQSGGSRSLAAVGLSLNDLQYLRVPTSGLELKRLLFPEKFDLRKEARVIRPRRRFLFWYREEEDPWID